MNTTFRLFFLLFSVLALWDFSSLAASTQKPSVIPNLKGIQIDGDPLDWGDAGFRVDILSDPDGQILPTHDFDVSFRLGWNIQGLVMLATITDDIRVKIDDTHRLQHRDRLDILLADHVGSHNFYQLTVATGEDEGSVTKKIHDRRHGVDTSNELTAEVAIETVADIMVVEAFLPWSNLGIEPETGTTLGFQFMANDDDGRGDRGIRLAWFPSCDTHYDPHKMVHLVLGHQASRPIDVMARRLNRMNDVHLEILGVQSYVGELIEIERDFGEPIELTFQSRLGRAVASIDLEPNAGDPFQPVEVFVGRQKVASFPPLPTASFVIERYWQALGGEDALDAINTRFCSGSLIHNLCYRTPQIEEIPTEISFGSPGTFHLSQTSSEKFWREGCDAQSAWKMDGDVISQVHRESLSVLRLILNPHHVLKLGDLYPEMTVRGRTVRDGLPVYHVEAKFGKGNRHQIFFDVSSGLISRWNHMRLEDYRQVDGVTIPFRIWTGRKGGSSTFVFDEITHNVEIDGNLFAMPDVGTQ